MEKSMCICTSEVVAFLKTEDRILEEHALTQSHYPVENDYYLPPRSTWSRVSPEHTKKQRGNTTWKIGSAMLIVSAMLVLIAVFAIAGLALWMGALRTDSKNAIIGFSCIFRVSKGEKYNPMLKLNTSMVFREKERKYKNIFEVLFRRSVLGVAYKQTIIDKFESGVLKVFFRIYLDRRKIPRSITSVEDTIEDIIAKETYSASSLFKDMELDLTAISVKRINQETLGSQKQKNAMITKNGLLRPNRNSSLITSSKPKSKPSKIESTELDIDFSNIPTIQGTYKATKVNVTSSNKMNSTQEPTRSQSNTRNNTKVSLPQEQTTISVEDTSEINQSAVQTTNKINEKVNYTVHDESSSKNPSTTPISSTKDDDLFKDFRNPNFETSPWKPIIPGYINTELKLLPDNVQKTNYKVNYSNSNLGEVVSDTTTRSSQQNVQAKVPQSSTTSAKPPEPPMIFNSYVDVPGMNSFDIRDTDFPRDRIVPHKMVNFRVNGKFKNKIPGLSEDDDKRPDIEVSGQLPSETYDVKLRTSSQPFGLSSSQPLEFSSAKPYRSTSENETGWRVPGSQVTNAGFEDSVGDVKNPDDSTKTNRKRLGETTVKESSDNFLPSMASSTPKWHPQRPIESDINEESTTKVPGVGVAEPVADVDVELEPRNRYSDVQAIAKHKNNALQDRKVDKNVQEPVYTSYKTPDLNGAGVRPSLIESSGTLKPFRHTIPVDKITSVVDYSKDDSLRGPLKQEINTVTDSITNQGERFTETGSTESNTESVIDDDKLLRLGTTEVYSEVIHPSYNNIDKLVVKNEEEKKIPGRLTLGISRNSTFIEIDTLKHTPGEVEEEASSGNKSATKGEDNWLFNGTLNRPYNSLETRKKIYNDTLKAYVVENLVTLAPAKSNTGIGRPVRPRPKIDREKTMRIDEKSSNRSSMDDTLLLEQLFGVQNRNRNTTKLEQIVEVVTSISTKVSTNFKGSPVVLKFVITNSTSLPVIHRFAEIGTENEPVKGKNSSRPNVGPLQSHISNVKLNTKQESQRPLPDFEKLKQIADIATGNETLMNSSAAFTLTRDGVEILTKILNKMEDRTDKMISSTEGNLEVDHCFGFLCRDGKCLPSTGRCNMLGECPNSEDEANCTCADFLKAQLLHEKICDGVADCFDYSDETDCDWCQEGQFVCGNSRTCINQDRVCNGYSDCPGGEDEKKCAALIEDDSALNYEETRHFSETESATNKDVLYDQEAMESSIFESTTLHPFKEDVRLEKLMSAKDESATKEETRFLENRERSNATTLVSGREISSSAKDVLTRGNSIHLNTENSDRTHTSATHLKKEINSYNEKGFLNIRKNGRWGKLCLSGMDDLLEERQAAWTIEDLGRAVCKAITYQDYETVEKVLDENPTSMRSYYTLSYNEKPLDKTILTFKPSKCPSGEILRVKCKNLECGIRTQVPSQARIVGGGSSLAGSWPWQVALYKEGDYQCGGALINERWILSAGHCFYHAQDEYWVARIGATRRGSFPSPYEQVLRLDHISLHPDYIDNGFINDIAMLRLEKPVTFSDYVRPVCLPDLEPKSGTMCTVTGWGQLFEIGRIFPDTLQEVQLPVISTEECRRKTLFLPLYRITSGMLCAGLKDGGRDACLGDSGGPLVCSESNNKYTLQGITSNGYGCARPGRPGVYTKVHHYLSWIEYVISREDIQSSIASCKGHRCPLGECLPKSRICNGFLECSDGSDERNCPVSLLLEITALQAVRSLMINNRSKTKAVRNYGITGTKRSNDTNIDKEILNKVGYKVEDLELKVNILTYKLQYGAWPLPQPHQVQKSNFRKNLRNLRLTLSNPNDRHNWIKHVLLRYQSDYNIEMIPIKIVLNSN
ncbi:Enteropeptidase [Melipona quadrifasciata]|uniref:Enteropeptidase n=1 Tax=Melipona quadrifasciata TaxID=166423 RepID=A0A0M9A8L1_9HYME|nr:Enteropeptidase [Melipona quadrifasciata]